MLGCKGLMGTGKFPFKSDGMLRGGGGGGGPCDALASQPGGIK